MALPDPSTGAQFSTAAPKLDLPTVTLCAATSVNVAATVAALEACLAQLTCADCLLFTDAEVTVDHPGIRIVYIARLDSSRAYSEFILKHLVDHIRTTHCLVVQWDGFVLDPRCWEREFLDLDYIGAPWPQFDDGRSVGNGGFSLRSRKLLEACRDPSFVASHPEDIAVCRINRPMLESRFGIRFADKATAQRFAFERTATEQPAFGFHGVFNMIRAVGAEQFWQLYASLDDPSTAFTDYRTLMDQLGKGRYAWRRRLRLTAQSLRNLLTR